MKRSFVKLAILFSVPLLTLSPASAAQSQQKGEPAPKASAAISAGDLYKGWRARQALGEAIKDKTGREVGTLHDLIVDADGRIAAAVLEGGGVAGIPDSVYRVPWTDLKQTEGGSMLTADLTNAGKLPEYGVLPGTKGVPTLPREFRISEVIGDYARLKTGRGFGVVSDAVFASDGRLVAVLITRDGSSGGGTFAFPYPGTTGRWDPGASYYGLPFVTPDQATGAGLRVESGQFRSAVHSN